MKLAAKQAETPRRIRCLRRFGGGRIGFDRFADFVAATPVIVASDYKHHVGRLQTKRMKITLTQPIKRCCFTSDA
jgi:hypothetical protein